MIGKNAAEAVPLIVQVGKSNPSYQVKRYCCEALSMICSNVDSAAIDFIQDVLLNTKTDSFAPSNQQKDADHARYMAALSLCRLASSTNIAVGPLKEALYKDSNRYVNGFALLALKMLGTEESVIVVDEYTNKTGGYCLKTSVDDPW
ncbi:hypothetical protein AKO1_014947 [Acrasis kona]|uniref:Alpha-adaptin n=1 Tax=Acrasis kona TaxID=1008807 RepID=A0AAW2Z274_9EUKA